jgi:PAS domain S-box-containing protein
MFAQGDLAEAFLGQQFGDRTTPFEMALEFGALGLWRHDLATQRIYHSRISYQSLGLTPPADGLPLERLRDLIHPDDLATVKASAERALATRETVDFEARYRHADGSWRQFVLRRVARFDADGRALDFIGVALDATASKSASEALRQVSSRLVFLGQSAGIGTWAYELQSGAVLWDAQMFRLRGIAPRDTAPTAEQRWEIVHPDDREPMRSEIAAAYYSTEPTEHEFRVRWPDGSLHWLASRSFVECDAGGAALRRIGINWDITGHKTAQAERHQRQQLLREADARTRMLAHLGHELRTPLSAVLGFAGLLQGDTGRLDAAERATFIEHIRASGEHLLALVNNVLAASSLQLNPAPPRCESVALEPLARQVMAMVCRQAERKAVRIEAGALDAQVMADPTALRQVLLNLLDNAVKYNTDGGWVRLDARDETLQGARFIVVSVADSGRGLCADQLARMFLPFERLGAESGPVEGVGLGLAVSQGLAERMGGSLRADSKVGQGCVFELRLPAA